MGHNHDGESQGKSATKKFNSIGPSKLVFNKSFSAMNSEYEKDDVTVNDKYLNACKCGKNHRKNFCPAEATPSQPTLLKKCSSEAGLNQNLFIKITQTPNGNELEIDKQQTVAEPEPTNEVFSRNLKEEIGKVNSGTN